MLLVELVEVSDAVGATRSRKEKVELLAGALRRLEPSEVAAGVAFLSGELRQGQIGVGWALLRDLPAPTAAQPTLTVGEVDAAFAAIGALSGAGSRAARAKNQTPMLIQRLHQNSKTITYRLEKSF